MHWLQLFDDLEGEEVEAILQLEGEEVEANLQLEGEEAEALPGSRGNPVAPDPPEVPIAPVAHVKTIGTPPQDFNGDRRQARDFVEELCSYMRVNQGVAGFESPICKVTLALTFIKGPDVT
jgi:hypothetical protein